MRSLLMLFTIFFFVSQASAQDTAADEPDIPPYWKNFATGSFVTVEYLRKVPQTPVSKSQVKTVLQEFGDSACTRYRGEDGFKKAERGSAGKRTLPEQVGFKKVASRDEKITVAGKEYSSTVTTLRMEDRRGKKELVIWEVKELTLHTRTMGMPGPDLLLNAHVVKAQLSLSGRGSSQKVIQTVVKFKEELNIGKHKISCLVEKLAGNIDRGGAKMNPVGEYWTSENIPGRIAKLVVSGTFSKDSMKWPGERFSESMIVVDFKAIRKSD